MSDIRVRFARIHPDARTPTRGSAGAAGFDLYSVDDVWIPGNGGSIIVPTGICVDIPPEYYGRIAPRSGLAAKNGIDVLAGVVDSDYRGEVRVILINHGKEGDFHVNKGDRIAQLIFERIGIPANGLEEVSHEQLTATDRGEAGFGSTGSS